MTKPVPEADLCPSCGSDDGDYEPVHYSDDGLVAKEEVRCGSCGTMWVNTWQYTGRNIVKGAQAA